MRASYVSYSFMVVRLHKKIGYVGRIVLGMLFGLSQGSIFYASW